MCNVRNIVLVLIVVGLAVHAFAQTNRATFIVDLEGGLSKSYFSNAASDLSHNSQFGLGKIYQVSAERIIKGRYGIGVLINNSHFQCTNEDLANDAVARLSTIPGISHISTSTRFAVTQTCYLLSASYLKQNKHWQLQGKLCAGVGVAAFNSNSMGAVPDTSTTMFSIVLSGTDYKYSVLCSSYVSTQAQCIVRYLLVPGAKTDVAVFASAGYSVQRLRFEYVTQNYRYSILSTPGTDYQTVSIWRQNMHNFSLRAGISIILNKKVS